VPPTLLARADEVIEQRRVIDAGCRSHEGLSAPRWYFFLLGAEAPLSGQKDRYLPMTGPGMLLCIAPAQNGSRRHRRACPLPAGGLRPARTGKRKICDRRHIDESGFAASDLRRQMRGWTLRPKPRLSLFPE
jgi:hypothetical protein